jgi:hypothetical protein
MFRSLWVSNDTLNSTLAKVGFTLDINDWGPLGYVSLLSFSALRSSSCHMELMAR